MGGVEAIVRVGEDMHPWYVLALGVLLLLAAWCMVQEWWEIRNGRSGEAGRRP